MLSDGNGKDEEGGRHRRGTTRRDGEVKLNCSTNTPSPKKARGWFGISRIVETPPQCRIGQHVLRATSCKLVYTLGPPQTKCPRQSTAANVPQVCSLWPMLPAAIVWEALSREREKYTLNPPGPSRLVARLWQCFACRSVFSESATSSYAQILEGDLITRCIACSLLWRRILPSATKS